MRSEPSNLKVAWYRSPVSRAQLQELNQRSDLKGFLQTAGCLALLALTGCAAYIAAGRWPWLVVVLLIFVHGTCWQFLTNGFHELAHNSVFKTASLNRFFVRVFAFLIWWNHYNFWASHTAHHQYTLHPPHDQEVVLPTTFTLRGFLLTAIVNPKEVRRAFGSAIMLAWGKLQGPWENALFADANRKERRRLFNCSRMLLGGHLAIIFVSVVMGWWLLPVLITLAPFYGGWLFYLCNNTQHAGLQDNVADLRLCCRTVLLNPFVSFLYWQMHYHTEHHMFAAVPCYHLRKLHALIEDDLPPSPRGLWETWQQIITIQRRQKQDTGYRYVPELPMPSRGKSEKPPRRAASVPRPKDRLTVQPNP